MELSTDEVKDLLMRHLDIKQADSVANVIIGHVVQTDKGLGQLFKAMVGVFPAVDYKVGDMVWVKGTALSSWKYDMEATKALPNYREDMILCQIKRVNVYQGHPYSVSFAAVKTGEKHPVEDTTVVSENSVVEKAEDFTDILDDLEKRIEEADLPF